MKPFAAIVTYWKRDDEPGRDRMVPSPHYATQTGAQRWCDDFSKTAEPGVQVERAVIYEEGLEVRHGTYQNGVWVWRP